jgi:hypothetical protein
MMLVQTLPNKHNDLKRLLLFSDPDSSAESSRSFMLQRLEHLEKKL